MARTYNQDCILAHALDLLGERWTLLILRDLFLGPRRFGDLQAGLPGLGANLLSKRLKELDESGVIEPTSEARAGYRLSEVGEALRPAVREMMRWSIMYFMSRNEPSEARDCIYSDNLQPDSVALALELFTPYCREPGLSYVAHLMIDNFPYTAYYMNEEMIVRRGADTPAAAKIITNVETMMQAFRGDISREEADARIATSGDANAIKHMFDCIFHEEKHAEMEEIKAKAAAAAVA